MSYSISKLAQEFGLSRSTLLYYDKLGLLQPSSRSAANYRLYSEADRERLARIMTYRETGMSLQAIGELLSQPGKVARIKVLEAQLESLGGEISRLRKQQELTLELLKSKGIDRPTRLMTKAQWTALLASAGMSDEDMWQWHREFEARLPAAHQDFLESLNIPKDEIKQIRRRSRSG